MGPLGWGRITSTQPNMRIMDVSQTTVTESGFKSLESLSKLENISFSVTANVDIEMIYYTLHSLPRLRTYCAHFECNIGNRNWWNRKMMGRKDLYWGYKSAHMMHPEVAFRRAWKRFRLVLALSLPMEVVGIIYRAYYLEVLLLDPNVPSELQWDYNWIVN